MPMAIGSAVSFATERGGERREDRRWRRKSGPLKGRGREEGEERRESLAVRKRRKRRRGGGRRWRKTNKKGRSALFAAARS